MKIFLQRLINFVAYTAAGVVILLAIAVGLFRLFLPRLPEYQEDIKSWASTAIGMNVEFSGMDARWGLSGPEVEFYEAELMSTDTSARIVAADEVSIGVGLLRLLVDRKLVVDRVVVRDTSLEVRQLENGQWWIQGSPLDQLVPKRRQTDASGGGQLEIVGEDIEVQFLQPGDERPRQFLVPRFVVNRDDVRIAVNATIELPDDLGGQVALAATQLLADADSSSTWDVTVDVDDVALAGVTALHSAGIASFSSGTGDLDLSLAYADGRVQSVAADIEFNDVSAAGEPGFSIAGLFEFRRDISGWLVAANSFQLQTVRGAWPDASLRIEVGTDSDGAISKLDVSASYLDLNDADMLKPWLSPEQNALLADYAPDGVIRDLAATISDFGAESPQFDATAELVEVGIASVDERPSVRGFTGILRADRSGGRLEIDSTGLTVNAPGILGIPAILDTATGTVIWRRSDNRTTVLWDSITIGNADFAMQTNAEITLVDDSSAPIVDLAGTWSISDIAIAKRYIPIIPRIPKTSEWFQQGLLAGRVPRGTVRLYGPMDKFPFDGGEGRFLIEANVRDARVMYQRRWPVAEVIDLDVTVENMRLYSERNHIVSVGNEVRNARIEIADFRQAVLSVNTSSTGPLDAVRRLLTQSPIGTDVFGGKLDRIAVSGDGTFSLDLEIPIREIRNFDFTAQLQTNNGGLKIEGFPAPVTDLSGNVTVRREDIDSESLGGTFLGRPVAIELMAAPESMPEYRLIASANGAATAGALVAELGLPLEGITAGTTDYSARLLFPRGKVETPPPFTIEVATDMAGLTFELPEPLRKSADEAMPLTARIELQKGGVRIDSTGMALGLLSWQLNFAKEDQQWDLDRGVVTFGGVETTAVAETRGLHLRGDTDYVRMQEWFDLGKGKDKQTGIAERIRSIDMTIGNLHIIGQHLVDHQLRVDRSARDWLIGIDGDDVVGSVIVPYDFRSGRPLAVDMERLVLPGDDEDAGASRNDIDPRGLPPISIKAADFAFGDRHLGAVEANFRHTADGLVSDSIVARDDTFEIVGSGGWIVDESDPTGNRSYVTASLRSNNVEQTMRRLDYDPGIVADDLTMQLDFGWSGGPRQEFMETLDGSVNVRIGTGQLDEVDPGAGRMFGLMSIVALPRRLSLDFRDVFGKGFGFDNISGDFRVVDGETYTCNLSLEGPAADIGIIGRAGLVNRDYDQVAVVSANFGNTLPMVGAVVGGPQVAAVLLVFSQLFKKPLKEVSQVYYSFGGSFDKPVIESTSADLFAERAAALGCIDD